MEFNNLVNMQNSTSKNSGLKFLEVGYVAYLGATPREFFPKLKDKFGNKLKSEDGKDLRADQPSGYMVSFATIGDNPKIVSAVFSDVESLDLKPLAVYQLSGYGYDIRQSNFVWIEEVEEFSLVNLNG